MSLIKKIVKSKPREESGSKTSRKYDFQKNLSLFLLMQGHSMRSDYVYLFDFFDDLVILDSETNPTLMDFYQFKSKDSGNWTTTELTRADKDKLSILGKLYHNRVLFKNNVSSLNFVSNAVFSFKTLKDGSDSKKMTTIKASLMDKSEVIICNKKIQNEHKLKSSPKFEKATSFHVTILSNQDSSTHCIGALSKLINSINPDNAINPELAYKQVLNEISRKTGNTVTDKAIDNLPKLIEVKGISKTQFLSYLAKAGLYKSVEQEWSEIKDSLEKEGIGYLELQKFKKYWREVSATLIKDTDKIPLLDLVNSIQDIVRQQKESGGLTHSMTLMEIINHCYNLIKTSNYDEYFIKCLIIKSANEA